MIIIKQVHTNYHDTIFFNSLVSSEEIQDQGRDVEEVKKVSEVDDSKEHINEDSIQNTESYSIAGIIMFLLYLPFWHKVPHNQYIFFKSGNALSC